MIYVDDIANRGAPWAGGMSCHMISDESTEELVAFARTFLALPERWLHRGSCDHFDLSERKRRRALECGAVALTGLRYSSKYWLAVAHRLKAEGKDSRLAFGKAVERAQMADWRDMAEALSGPINFARADEG